MRYGPWDRGKPSFPDMPHDWSRTTAEILTDLFRTIRKAAGPLDWQENTCPSRWLIHGKEQQFNWLEENGGEPDFLP